MFDFYRDRKPFNLIQVVGNRFRISGCLFPIAIFCAVLGSSKVYTWVNVEQDLRIPFDFGADIVLIDSTLTHFSDLQRASNSGVEVISFDGHRESPDEILQRTVDGNLGSIGVGGTWGGALTVGGDVGTIFAANDLCGSGLIDIGGNVSDITMLSELEGRGAASTWFGKLFVGTVTLLIPFLSLLATWEFRGSSLLTSALSTIPIWRTFDPLPILDTEHEGDQSQLPFQGSAESEYQDIQDRAEAFFEIDENRTARQKGRRDLQ